MPFSLSVDLSADMDFCKKPLIMIGACTPGEYIFRDLPLVLDDLLQAVSYTHLTLPTS